MSVLSTSALRDTQDKSPLLNAALWSLPNLPGAARSIRTTSKLPEVVPSERCWANSIKNLVQMDLGAGLEDERKQRKREGSLWRGGAVLPGL